MTIDRVIFHIADNGVSGAHIHVLLSDELPAAAKLWDIVELPAPFYLTGVRSPPSRYATIQSVGARKMASNLQGDPP